VFDIIRQIFNTMNVCPTCTNVALNAVGSTLEHGILSMGNALVSL